MVKDIAYSGYTANTSDYECADGEMAAMLNLIAEDGHLTTIPRPSEKIKVPSGFYVKHIHKTAEYTHYIVTKGKSSSGVYWRSDDNLVNTLVYNFTGGIENISSIGNVLCVFLKAGIHYFLWSNGMYVNLGIGLPDVRLSFGLQCEIKRGDPMVIPMGDLPHSRIDTEGEYTYVDGTNIKVPKLTNEDDIKTLTDTILAGVNKLITENIVGENRFCMPFFVRYALRLYDGTLTRQSAPILMLPTNVGSPVVRYFTTITGSVINPFYYFIPYAPSCKLDMTCVNLSNIENYSDIVSSVDIFVSAPIYSYDQNGKCRDFANISSDNSFGIFSLNNANAPEAYSASVKKSNKWKIQDAIRAVYGEESVAMLKLPQKDKSVITSELENCSSFYLYKSIPVKELSKYQNRRVELSVQSGVMKSLVNRETLTDDFDSHDTIIATNSFNYNSRMHLYGMSKILFDGYFSMPNMDSYFTCTFSPTESVETPSISGMNTYKDACLYVDDVFVYVKRNGKTYRLKESFGRNGYLLPYIVNSNSIANIDQNSVARRGYINAIPFFYYPDPNAYEAHIVCHKASDVGVVVQQYQIILPLKRHSMLNGAFYFDSFNAQQAYFMDMSLAYSSDKKVSMPNKIYVSDVNNPFYFPVTGIVSVGTGDVVGLGSATKALSEGQFGSFPLYAFTTEGIWSLSVSEDGTYRSVQPVSRDVCTNTKSITPIDSSVLYATEMGIKKISGSETEIISDSLFSEYDTTFNNDFIPHIADIYTQIHSGLLQIKAFPDFVKKCQMVYDNKRQYIIVFNPTLNVKYAYVMSQKSKKWSMAVFSSPLRSTINSYPDSMAVAYNGTLVSFTDNVSLTNPISGFYVTRPMKLDTANILKTIRTIIQRGTFKNTNIRTVLYGSVDLNSWHIIGSSRDQSLRYVNGTPYKYFRVAGLCNLLKNESITGVSFDFDTRYMNKLL